MSRMFGKSWSPRLRPMNERGRLAAYGAADAGDTAEGPPRFEGEFLVQLERQARRVWLLTLVTALVLTLVATMLAIATS